MVKPDPNQCHEAEGCGVVSLPAMQLPTYLLRFDSHRPRVLACSPRRRQAQATEGRATSRKQNHLVAKGAASDWLDPGPTT